MSTHLSRRTALRGLGMLSGASLLAPAIARAQAPTIAQIAALQGPDRAERLLAGARAEGNLMMYGSMPVEDMQALTGAFEQRTGVAVRTWRGSSENVLQRGIAEYRGGRFDADVFETNGPELEALYRERVLQDVQSPALADIIPEAKTEHRQYVGTRMNIYALAYNTSLVRRDEVPTQWSDFTNPRWRGRLAVEAENSDWFATVVRQLGEEQGLRIFREIVATNGISVRRGHTLLSNLVVSGEVPLALCIYDYRARQLKDSGAPLDYFYLEPTPARINGIAVSNRSRKPHATILFYDFMLTEGQRILSQRGFSPTNRTIGQPPSVRMQVIDNVEMLNNGQRWQTLFRDIILRQSR